MKFGIVGNTKKTNVNEVAWTLIHYLQQKEIPFVIHDELGLWLNKTGSTAPLSNSVLCNGTDIAKRSEMLIALGGDGTMLMAARMVHLHETPILGINLGKLGFLAEVSVNEVRECLDDILLGSYVIEERSALIAKTSKDNKSYFALNEIVVDRGSSPRVIDLETVVNEEYLVTYTADGIIVTTPTGSTAYSLASGGPIVDPRSRVLTINPVSAHMLTARPVVVPDDNIIKVAIRSGVQQVHITADGQIEGLYDPPVEFYIQKASHPVRLVKRNKRSYFDVLRTKLLWGKDLRQENNT